VTTQILTWWLVAQALGLIALPLTAFFFRALPDRGYAFSKSLGLLLTGYLAWLIAMLGLSPFGAPLIIVCALIIGGGGLLLLWRGTESERSGLRSLFTKSWPLIVGYEALFLAALVFVALLRATNPDPWGTERPMDFALFNAIQRSSAFPPHDPWLSGYSINYYYFGYLLMAVMALLSGLEPSVAYNLSLSLIFALTALGVAGGVVNLVALTSGVRGQGSGVRSQGSGVRGQRSDADGQWTTADERQATEDERRGVLYTPAAVMSLPRHVTQSAYVGSISDNQWPVDVQPPPPDDGRPITDQRLPMSAAKEPTINDGSAIIHNESQTTDHGQWTTDDEPRMTDHRRRTTNHRLRTILALFPAILSVVFVLLAANQGGALQVITGIPMILALPGEEMARAITNGIGPRDEFYLEEEFRGWDFNGTRVITPTDMVENFNWWNPSRALWDDYTGMGTPERRYTITEFPLFSFWLGDMHPHVMALPFGLLALALALNTLTHPSASAFGAGWRGWVELAITGVVLGSLYTINSWDFPTYLLLFLGALLLLYIRFGRQQAVGSEPTDAIADVALPSFAHVAWKPFLTQSISAIIASVALFLPFYLTFRSLVGSKDPLIDLPILASVTRAVGFLTWTKTPLHTFVIIFGLFLVPLIAFVFAQRRRVALVVEEPDDDEGEEEAEKRSAFGWQRVSSAIGRERSTLEMMPWVTLVILVAGLLIGFPLLFLLPLAIFAIMLAMAHADRPAISFTLWAFALVCLICFGTEIVYIRDTFEGSSARMNTIFKFYYQAWLIWGLLAGYAVWWLVGWAWGSRGVGETRRQGDEVKQSDSQSSESLLYSPPPLLPYSRKITVAFVGLLFVPLLIGALVYPWLTAGKTLRDYNPIGLHGKTPRQNTPAGAEAINWLRSNVANDSVVLEAAEEGAAAYDSSGLGIGGVSASTGFATVLGWPGHQNQWRGGDPQALAQIAPRAADVTTIYNTTDAAQARMLLQQYNVDYVYIGAAEQSKYAPEGLAKFVQLGTPVFQRDEVTIYQINA
jgi:YYY domain-containing protein